jgi:hypothetical protein
LNEKVKKTINGVEKVGCQNGDGKEDRGKLEHGKTSMDGSTIGQASRHPRSNGDDAEEM